MSRYNTCTYSRFNSIFAVRSFGQLQAMYKEYEKISKNSIETVIMKEMSGDIEKTYLSIGMLKLL